MRTKTEIFRVANNILKKSKLKFGKKPVIDVRKLAKKYGIEVRERELDDDISGALKMADGDSAIILINKNHHENRKRFTIAHELGHFFLHKTQGVHVDKVFMRDTRSSEGLHPIEVEANRFASEILMPSTYLTQILENELENEDPSEAVQLLAERFGVSAMAMTFKLQEMGYISPVDL